MNGPMSLLVAALGAVLLWLTHHGILVGKLFVGKGTSRAILVTDSGFWFHAGTQVALGLVMIALSMAYLTTGYKYLPEVDRKNTASYLAFSAVLVVVTFLLGSVLKFVLPAIYT